MADGMGFRPPDTMTAPITIIRSIRPDMVCKRYTMGPNGIEKKAVAHVTEGEALGRDVPDAAAMVALLREVTESPDLVICPGAFHGAGTEPFRLVPEKQLATMLNGEVGAVPGGVHNIGGSRVAARLKRGITPSPWLLLDADNPPGMPEDWQARTIGERLRMLDVIIPGISTCERIELRGSSARVVTGSAAPGAATHAWVRVSHPGRIAMLKAHATIAMVTAGLSFASPRYSRIEPGKVVGHQHRTVVDLSVWDTGRLVFCARPDVQVPDYRSASAGIELVNAGGGVLDISNIEIPDRSKLNDYAERTGHRVEIEDGRDAPVIRSFGELTWETEIEVRGQVKPLREWVSTMRPGGKKRCETPFRASSSEAGVIRLRGDGKPVLHDVGTGTTYHLEEEPPPEVGPDYADEFQAAREQFQAEEAAASIELTEDGVAIRFAEQHGHEFRYCHDTGKWFVWTGTHWQMNRDRLAFQAARELVRALNRSSEFKTRAITGKVAFAGGVETFAQRDRVFAVTAEIWDRNNTLLGTPGGTVDLVTGHLRPATQEDFITRVTAVAPAEIADCPTWLAFLKQATADDIALIRFLQQWCGYCLTGSTREHALLFIYGPGGNGKSVFLNTVAGILAQYCTTAPMDTFTSSTGDRHPTDLAGLRGARVVTATETEEGRAWAEAKIKQMTGGDPIAARFMRQDFFTFTPNFKLTIAGNHKPALRNVDEAAKRRFNIVPFLHKPAQPDRQLEAKLKKEWPGILRWMIEGCLDWQKVGLVRPPIVTEATEEYFEAQDVIGRWMGERCILAPHLVEKPGNLASDCRDWAGKNGEAVPTPPQVRSALEKVPGVRFAKVKGDRQAHGIGLRPPETQQRGAWGA